MADDGQEDSIETADSLKYEFSGLDDAAADSEETDRAFTKSETLENEHSYLEALKKSTQRSDTQSHEISPIKADDNPIERRYIKVSPSLNKQRLGSIRAEHKPTPRSSKSENSIQGSYATVGCANTIVVPTPHESCEDGSDFLADEDEDEDEDERLEAWRGLDRARGGALRRRTHEYDVFPPDVRILGTRTAQSVRVYTPQQRESKVERPVSKEPINCYTEPEQDGDAALNSMVDDVTINELGLCVEIDRVLIGMYEVNRQMAAFHEYIVANRSLNMPLYQWPKYDGYSEISHSSRELDKAVDHLKTREGKLQKINMPRKHASSYLDRALNFSTTTSKVTVFALQTMSSKSANCLAEIDDSKLSGSEKDAAKMEITSELSNFMENSTDATESVYSAMDLLRKIIYSAMEEILDSAIEKQNKRGSWKEWALLCISLLSLGIASFGLYNQLSSSKFFPFVDVQGTELAKGYGVAEITALQSTLNDTISAVSEANKLDNLVTSARLKYLEETYDTTGQRIDNIWDALGPPNAIGGFDIGRQTGNLNEKLAQGIQDVRQDVNKQLEKIQREMKQLDTVRDQFVELRRYVHRVDLRLTHRLDDIVKGRGKK
ncbi:hypothetical protein K504DRAFT_406794 [Pleomassaria siparia CBS 279.74]|uniref:Uncharacterized protein n=1 Tax=Pleomassaria siparia CBS 279.74 TaxID=1314801 RepID=A0A6G1K9N9_9PLEO|nr:hypothetical protein K504DRAFT_406794 [Pleomassaria siparia CBS 279.74]